MDLATTGLKHKTYTLPTVSSMWKNIFVWKSVTFQQIYASRNKIKLNLVFYFDKIFRNSTLTLPDKILIFLIFPLSTSCVLNRSLCRCYLLKCFSLVSRQYTERWNRQSRMANGIKGALLSQHKHSVRKHPRNIFMLNISFIHHRPLEK